MRASSRLCTSDIWITSRANEDSSSTFLNGTGAPLNVSIPICVCSIDSYRKDGLAWTLSLPLCAGAHLKSSKASNDFNDFSSAVSYCSKYQIFKFQMQLAIYQDFIISYQGDIQAFSFSNYERRQQYLLSVRSAKSLSHSLLTTFTITKWKIDV